MSGLAERINKALEGITPGPWMAVSEHHGDWGEVHPAIAPGDPEFPFVAELLPPPERWKDGHPCWHSVDEMRQADRDATFIADAPTLLAEAVTELRRLEAERSDHLWLLSGSRMTLDGIAEGREGPTEAAAQAQRIVDHIGHRLTDEPPHTLVENDELRGWKESAINVLSEWDKVFDALGRPGKLGASKAESARAEVERILAESDRVSRKDER